MTFTITPLFYVNYTAVRRRCFTLCESPLAENWQTTTPELMRRHCVKRASKRNTYRGLQSGHLQEIDRRVCEFVIEKRNESFKAVFSYFFNCFLFLKISLEKRGHIIITVVLYSGQYGTFSTVSLRHKSL